MAKQLRRSGEAELAFDPTISEARKVYETHVETLSFIHSSLDEADLTSEEFRVYCHLLRRADNSRKVAYPSYQSIGDSCLSRDYNYAGTRRKHAIKAVKGLTERNMIIKEARKDSSGKNTSNVYYLTSPAKWQVEEGAVPTETPTPVQDTEEPVAVPTQEPSVMPVQEPSLVPTQALKGTPIEGTPIEGTPIKTRVIEGQHDQPIDFRTGKLYSKPTKRGQTLIIDALKKAMSVGVDKKHFIRLVNVYLDAHHLTELADLDTPAGMKSLSNAQTAVETLVMLGVREDDELRNLITTWHQDNEWFGGKVPQAGKYAEHYLKLKREDNGQPTLRHMPDRHETGHDKYDYSSNTIEPPDEPSPGFPGKTKVA